MREVFKRNLGYKSVSLVFALLLWLWVTNQNSGQVLGADQTLTIPLVARYLPANAIVMTKLPSVRVRLQGYNPSVNIKDLYAYVDLSEAAPGEHKFVVKMDPIPEIKVLEMEPVEVSLKIDQVQEKLLPVQVNVTGIPAAGFTAGQPVVRPAAVNVRGPGSILATMDKVVTEVSIDGTDDTVQVSRPVSLRDKNGKPVFGPDPGVDIFNISPASVDVIVPILAKGLASKVIPVKPLVQGTPASGMVVRAVVASPASVEVFGSSDALKGFDALAVGPFDVSNLNDTKAFPVSLDKVALPAGVNFAPGTVLTVVAQIGPAPEQKALTVPIQVRNVPPGLEVDQAPAPLTITIQGYPEIVRPVTGDQVALWVDATGLAAGSNQNLKVYWQLPPGVEMVNIPSVTLSLKTKIQ